MQVIAETLAERRAVKQETKQSHLLDFLIAEKRLAFISDPTKPWQYQGWLLPYIILANAMRSDVVDRWGWWTPYHLKAKLVQEPIPQIHFESEFGPGTKDAFKTIDRCLE